MNKAHCLNCHKEVSSPRKFCCAACRTEHSQKANKFHNEQLRVRIAELERIGGAPKKRDEKVVPLNKTIVGRWGQDQLSLVRH
jgi:hypothetical protein